MVRRCLCGPWVRLTFVLFCFVFLCNWVRWDMSDRPLVFVALGAFFVETRELPSTALMS